MADLTKKKAEALFNGAMNMFSSPSSSKVMTPTQVPEMDAKGVNRSDNMESNPEDIPKEDLLHLCMKLNKRMQSLETKNQELIKSKSLSLLERKQLIDAVKQKGQLSVNSSGDDGDFDVESAIISMKKFEDVQKELIASLEQKICDLEQSKILEMNEAENRFRRELSSLQRNLSVTAMNVVASAATFDGEGPSEQDPLSVVADNSSLHRDYNEEENERLNKEKDEIHANQVGLLAKIKKLEAQNEEIKLAGISAESRITVVEEKLGVKNEELLTNKKKNEELRIKAEEKIMYLQLQLNNVKGREELAGNDCIAMKKEVEKMKEAAVERDMVLSQRKELIEKLQNKLFENENDFTSLRQKVSDGERNLTALKMLKDESQSLVAALRKDLRSVFDSKEQAIARVQELEEYKLKTENINVKILDMDTQINALQAQVEDRNTIITRLKSDFAVSDRSVGLKSASLVAAEAQLCARDKEKEAMRKEMTSQTESLFQALQKIKTLELKMDALENDIAEKSQGFENEKRNLYAKESVMVKKYENQLTEMKLNAEERIEIIKKENAKKSSLARTLLTEREEENNFLKTKNEELISEIKSGSPSDRKFFELAEIQAKREAVHGQHGSNREIAFQQLQSGLAEKDFELAKLQLNQSNLVAEISELRRHTKREGVNLDYLKNIVLQYMSFPLQSPEKISLVPVIATLLQFNTKELEQVLKDPLKGSRPVKEVKRALIKASASTALRIPNNTANISAAHESSEPLLGEGRIAGAVTTPGRTLPETALEFECEEEGVMVGGNR